MPSFNTVQEAADYAVQKIVEQGMKCGDSSGCVYAYDDMHCAIGWIVFPNSDDGDKAREAFNHLEVYHSDSSVSTVIGWAEERDAETLKDLPNYELIKDNLPVFAELQNFHDYELEGLRDLSRERLSSMGLDTSGKHWQDWLTIDVEED